MYEYHVRVTFTSLSHLLPVSECFCVCECVYREDSSVMIACKGLYKIDFVFSYTPNKTNLTLALALMFIGHEHYYCTKCHNSAYVHPHVHTVQWRYVLEVAIRSKSKSKNWMIGCSGSIPHHSVPTLYRRTRHNI